MTYSHSISEPASDVHVAIFVADLFTGANYMNAEYSKYVSCGNPKRRSRQLRRELLQIPTKNLVLSKKQHPVMNRKNILID